MISTVHLYPVDDVAVAGDRDEVAREILRFEQPSLGLSLNHSKCQVWPVPFKSISSDLEALTSRCVGAHATAGAPLRREGLDEVLTTHCNTLSLAVSREKRVRDVFYGTRLPMTSLPDLSAALTLR